MTSLWSRFLGLFAVLRFLGGLWRLKGQDYEDPYQRRPSKPRVGGRLRRHRKPWRLLKARFLMRRATHRFQRLQRQGPRKKRHQHHELALRRWARGVRS